MRILISVAQNSTSLQKVLQSFDWMDHVIEMRMPAHRCGVENESTVRTKRWQVLLHIHR